jgi:hypothetical protein
VSAGTGTVVLMLPFRELTIVTLAEADHEVST